MVYVKEDILTETLNFFKSISGKFLEFITSIRDGFFSIFEREVSML